MKKNYCKCDASCGENRRHIKGSSGCRFEERKGWFCDQCGKMKEIVYDINGSRWCNKCIKELQVVE